MSSAIDIDSDSCYEMYWWEGRKVWLQTISFQQVNAKSKSVKTTERDV